MGQRNGVRPTKRCLDDLRVSPPTADVPLSLVEADPVPEAQAHPERFEAGGVERIQVLKDRVWFKMKTSRWRGAVVRLTDDDLLAEAEVQGQLAIAAPDRWWLGAAGTREDGSRRDFYEAIASASQCEKTPEKRDGVSTDDLLPQPWDRKRLLLERTYQQRKIYEEVMLVAAAKSLRCGKAVMADFSAYSMGVLIRADSGDQFVAFIAKNVLDVRVLAAMLDAFPGIDNDDWAPEPGGAFGLDPGPGEVVYSTVLPAAVADSILERVPWSDE